MNDNIVSRESIRELASSAAKAQTPRHEANPFPHGSASGIQFDRDYNSALYALQAEQFEGSEA